MAQVWSGVFHITCDIPTATMLLAPAANRHLRRPSSAGATRRVHFASAVPSASAGAPEAQNQPARNRVDMHRDNLLARYGVMPPEHELISLALLNSQVSMLEDKAARERNPIADANQIRALEERIARRDATIIADENQIRALEEQLARQDATIIADANQIRALKEQLARRDATIIAGANQIRALEEQLAETKMIIQALNNHPRTTR